MYPWGTNYGGGHQPPSQQNFGAPSPQGEGFGGGFGSYGAATPAATPGSTFNSLREQHLQQMQQLQQLHQKQLQSVLHHDRNVDANPYGGGGTAAESWQGSTGYGYGSTGPGAPSPYQDEYQTVQAGPPGPQQQLPPQPPQSPQSKEAQPPPPDSTLPVPTQNNGTPATKEVNKKESLASKDQAHSSASEEEKPDFTSMSLQVISWMCISHCSSRSPFHGACKRTVLHLRNDENVTYMICNYSLHQEVVVSACYCHSLTPDLFVLYSKLL